MHYLRVSQNRSLASSARASWIFFFLSFHFRVACARYSCFLSISRLITKYPSLAITLTIKQHQIPIVRIFHHFTAVRNQRNQATDQLNAGYSVSAACPPFSCLWKPITFNSLNLPKRSRPYSVSNFTKTAIVLN